MAGKQKRDHKGRFAGDYSAIRKMDKDYGAKVDKREAVIKRVSRTSKRTADAAAGKMSAAFATYKKSPTESNRQKWIKSGDTYKSAQRDYLKVQGRTRKVVDAKRPLPRAPGSHY